MHEGKDSSVEELGNLLDSADGPITALANASAFLYAWMKDVNWVGFYLLRDDALYLGPFQGKPACTRIRVGSGVCGTAVAEGRALRVDNVHAFSGHIACDSASNSELVVPLWNREGAIAGVLDIDSPLFARFSAWDEAQMERAARIVSEAVDWDRLKESIGSR